MPAFILNDNIMELRELTAEVDDTFINNLDPGKVECTIKTEEGIAVMGQSWPVNLLYVSASDGVYRGIIEDEVDFGAEGGTFVAHIDVDAGVGREAHWEFVFKAKVRKVVDTSTAT